MMKKSIVCPHCGKKIWIDTSYEVGKDRDDRDLGDLTELSYELSGCVGKSVTKKNSESKN